MILQLSGVQGEGTVHPISIGEESDENPVRIINHGAHCCLGVPLLSSEEGTVVLAMTSERWEHELVSQIMTK